MVKISIPVIATVAASITHVIAAPILRDGTNQMSYTSPLAENAHTYVDDINDSSNVLRTTRLFSKLEARTWDGKHEGAPHKGTSDSTSHGGNPNPPKGSTSHTQSTISQRRSQDLNDLYRKVINKNNKLKRL